MPRTAHHMPATLAASAYDLFGAHGFDRVTIDQLAAHAGVTKGSFYSHYQSKREIVLAACQYYYRTYQSRVHREIAALTDPVDRLRAIVELSVRTCVLDRPARVFTTEIFALSLRDERVRAGWLQFYDAVRELYIGLVDAVKAAGRTTIADSRATVNLMLVALEGTKVRAVYEPQIASQEEQQQIVEQLMSIMVTH